MFVSIDFLLIKSIIEGGNPPKPFTLDMDHPSNSSAVQKDNITWQGSVRGVDWSFYILFKDLPSLCLMGKDLWNMLVLADYESPV